MSELKPGTQLFINGKWYFDVKSVDGESVKVRIKYSEGTDKSRYQYKVITLPSSLFINCAESGFITTCQVVERDLKRKIGGLIDRLAVEPDILRIVEDGMGAVASPGLSGTPGVPGSAGSGDIAMTNMSASVMPSGEFGLEIVPRSNRRQIRKLLKKNKNSKTGIKTPLLNVLKEANETGEEFSDNDYKKALYDFLDYPADNEYDIQFIATINEWRPDFLSISAERIKQYFTELYKTNKALIVNKCSDWFKNNMSVLGDIAEQSI